jgi:hypothetical protein
MEASDRLGENAVSGIPLSYIRVMYIRHNILSTNLNSLCSMALLCLIYISGSPFVALCSTLSYIQQLSDTLTMYRKELA